MRRDSEAHAEVVLHAEVFLQAFKTATDSLYTGFLKRKLVVWYQLEAAPKSDWNAPS